MTETYPGSKRQVRQFDVPYLEPEKKLELGKPTIFLAGGKPVELYPVGAVAKALNRQPVTIRKWETEGVIPRSLYHLPSRDPRGQRRLYTKDQIEGLRRVAAEEGLLEPNARGKWKSIESTGFKEKALLVFKGGQ